MPRPAPAAAGGQRLPAPDLGEAVDGSAEVSLLARCDMLKTLCSDTVVVASAKTSGGRVALTVDFTPGPI